MIRSLLGRIGRRSGLLLAIGIFAGLAIPPLAALLRPLLGPAVFALLVLSLMRIEGRALVGVLKQPLRLGLSLVWLLLASPLVVALVVAMLPLDPFLAQQLVLTAAAAPIIATAAFALMLGLDAAGALATTIVATALLPLTLPPMALVLLGIELDIRAGALLLRLALLIGGAFLVASLLRRQLGRERIEAARDPFDGATVLVLLTFGAAVMDNVTATLIRDPGFVLTTIVALFALAIGLQIAGSVIFGALGRKAALTVGLMSGYNNLGIVMAALGAAAEDRMIVFLGLAQFPIYLMPMVNRWVFRRFNLAGETAA